MSIVSPTPNSSPPAVPPAAPPPPSLAVMLPTSSSSPPPTSHPSRPNANPPDPSAPSPPSPPPQTSPPPVATATPPPDDPPPPVPPTTPPPESPGPSPPPAPPTTSPANPPANPPKSPPPPPQTLSPPPPSSPRSTSPSSAPVGQSQSPPPPAKTPAPPSRGSRPPPPAKTPDSSSPPPPSRTPTKSPPPPVLTPPPASQPASSNSTPNFPPLPSPIFSSSSAPLSSPATPGSPAPVLDSTGNSSPDKGGIVAIAAVLAIILLSFVGFAIWCLKKRRKKSAGLNGGYLMPSSSASSRRSDSPAVKSHPLAPLLGSSSGSELVNSPRKPNGLGNSGPWFTYQQLVEATTGFSSQNLLGEGGFGSVYKGYLPDGREIAVKQLKVGAAQGEREFKAEIEIISRIHHRHLVSLVGYCIADTRRLLVYDFVSNYTLYFHLHGEGRPVLDWAKRIKIAAGAARGLAYLHEDCHPRIIHRDIKSSNILLDNNFEARVSDFGLAKLALDANTHVTTRVMGTFGYMAPEYALSGRLTEKSDVYSFGVVLLELITGRKPVDTSQPLGDESLVEWARPLLSQALDKEEFQGLADPRLENNFVESEMFRMIEAAAACVQHSAAKRPHMGQVVRALDNLATSDLTNGMRVGESEIFNSAEQSEEIRLFRRMAFGSQDYSTEFFSRTNSYI